LPNKVTMLEITCLQNYVDECVEMVLDQTRMLMLFYMLYAQIYTTLD